MTSSFTGGTRSGPVPIPELASEIDARLSSLHRIADTLHEVVEGTRQESPIFNISMFETRAGAISTMRQLFTDLQKLTAIVVKNGAAAEALHREELKAAQEGLNRAQSQAADGALARLQPEAARSTWSKITSINAPVPVPRPITPAPVCGPVRGLVTVVNNIVVDALILPLTLKSTPEIFAAIVPGDLCYVPYWNHFAVRIGGCVFHANLGRIYRGAPPRGAGTVALEMPERVKECRRAKCGGAGMGCRYYHDPENFAGATDVRNFMADSWYYTPAASPARYGTRRIGSAGDIEADIRAVSLDEARRFLHQTAHDILCAMVLWQHVLAPAQRQKNTETSAPKNGRQWPVA